VIEASADCVELFASKATSSGLSLIFAKQLWNEFDVMG
jgi:hypothetical protein